MTDIEANTAANPVAGLRKNYVSFIEDVAQSIGATAPSGGLAALIPLVFATAGNATWFLFLLVLIAYLPVTYNINVFARRIASPGGLHAYTEAGLGRFWGLAGGWCYIIGMLFGLTDAGLIVIHFCMVLAGSSATALLAIAVAAVLVPLTWWIACRDIRLSTDVTLRLECISVGAMLFLSVLYLIRSGHVVDAPQIHLEGMTANGLRLALVLAFFSAPGYESSTTLGGEATDPHRSIPRSLLLSLIPVMLLYVFMSYILVGAFRGAATPLDQATSPFDTLAVASGLPIFGPIMTACFAISFFACVVAALNACARIIYSMARQGEFSSAAGRVHPTHATPQVAITTIIVAAVAISVGLTACGVSIMDAFGWTAQISSFAFLGSYLLVSVAMPFFLRKRDELKAVDVASAVAAVLFLILPIFGSLYPVPPGPEKYLPYVFVAVLVSGVAYSSVLVRRGSAKGLV